MGKIVNSTFVSLDGVINHMDRWHFDFVDDESDAFALQQLRDSDALLMGRRTYDVYAERLARSRRRLRRPDQRRDQVRRLHHASGAGVGEHHRPER